MAPNKADQTNSQSWQAIAQKKQFQRLASIPSQWRLDTKYIPSPEQVRKGISLVDIPAKCGILTERELEITGLDATRLIEMLALGGGKKGGKEGGEGRGRGLSAVQVTTAFCKRAAVCHQLTNCLTEIFFAEALERAKYLDDYLVKHNKLIGPLHGLPISLKDSFRIKGLDASIGIATLCFRPATENSALVDLLLRAGAVLYVKTNVPQTLMALDSHNNIFGRTLNPWNTALTAGGSSGGEGVLVGMKGSPLGVGTDVGGSIRIPAMCNGIWGIKPSHGRVPYSGQEGGAKEGSEVLKIRASAGPLARSRRDLELFFRVLGEMEPWRFDAETIAQDWNQQVTLASVREAQDGGKKRKLRVGIVRRDGVTELMPPVAKFLDEVATALKKTAANGIDIDVVEMDITPVFSKCMKLFNGISSSDGGGHMLDLLDATDEPLSPWVSTRLTRRAPASVDRLLDLHAQKTRLEKEFLNIWSRSGGFWEGGKGQAAGVEGTDDKIDIFICPVAPHTTPPIDGWNTAGYTSSLVLLDYPAATLPVRQVRSADLNGEIGGKVLGGWDKGNRTLWAETEKATWLGGWQCLQIVGRRREERVIIEAMGVLEEALKSLGDIEEAREKAKL